MTKALHEMREGRRRSHRQLPPARRFSRLRHAGPHGAGLFHAVPAHRRPGQLRIHRRRSARGLPVHRVRSTASRRTCWRTSTRTRSISQPNFDESLQEPRSCPARIPNLLINGSTGIAVGMATNIPPHQPRRNHRRQVAADRQPEATVADLMKLVQGPDFPTGGMICGTSEHQAHVRNRDAAT